MIPFRRSVPVLTALVLLTVLPGCAVGPDYQRPALTLPSAYKHEAGWRTLPAADELPAGDWWAQFADAGLADLLRQATTANQTLAQADARYRQAEALLRAARADFLPTLTGSVGGTRGGGRAVATDNQYEAGLALSWAPDLWGRVRRQVEAGRADLAASAADLAAVRLSVQLAVAESYIRLRTLDRQQALLLQTQAAYERALRLTRNQYEVGLVSRSDVIQSETQLQSLLVQLAGTREQRAREENALAVLTGQVPALFALPAGEQLPALPVVPGQLPSLLLARRPDVVHAEQQLVAANARIGVAQTAWLPALTLGASGDWRSTRLPELLGNSATVWAVGPTLAQTLFDGGARRAAVAQARARHEELAAAYRQAVLTGLREVEDALASLDALALRAERQQRLVALAEDNERVVDNRYRAGMVTFLEVATAQNLTLDSRRTALAVSAEQLLASVQLLAALGGGWQAE